MCKLAGWQVHRLAALMVVVLWPGVVATAYADTGAKTVKQPSVTTTRIEGATQIFQAAWGLAAQGSGQLRILPAGSKRWTTVHHVKGDTLYRIALDDAGRLLASWEKEPHFHLFVPSKRVHKKLTKPAPPSPDFKYGYAVANLYFTSDGDGAIVYMSGFLGGRTWGTVAYHYDLVGSSEPTLLYQQNGHSLHTSARNAVYALAQDDKTACEHNSCHPLGSITAWEIAGTKATKRVLLAPPVKNAFSRVRLVDGSDDAGVAVLVTEHPHKRHVLRWRTGDAKAEFHPLPAGPTYDTEGMRLKKNGDLIEVWLTSERGLQIKRVSAKAEEVIATLEPLPRRTPNDRPLFKIDGSFERSNGDLVLHWGEYLVQVPAEGPVERLDMRPLFKGNRELAGNVLYVPAPEGFWISNEVGRALEMRFLPVADVRARAQRLPRR